MVTSPSIGDVVRFQVGVGLEDFVVTLTGGEEVENIGKKVDLYDVP